MRLIKHNYIILQAQTFVLLLCMVLMSSCDIDDEMEVCEYNTRLIYQYNRENTVDASVLAQYVQSLDEYIFDEQGILLQINRLPGNSCFGTFVSETNLPQGKYSVITWGNKGTPSKINEEQIGITSRDQMMLYLENPTPNNNGLTQDNSERLFFGYRTFSVHQYGVSKVHVDMTHSHCVLNVTVKWKNATEIPPPGDYYMLLKQLPSHYNFMPEYVFKNQLQTIHNPVDDEYPKDTREILHYIPQVYETSYLVTHYRDRKFITGNQINMEFISYRLRNNSHELLSLYAADGTQIMKEIDLYRFFQLMNIELDTNLRQEFEIEIEIDGNTVVVGLVNIGDWDEGGTIGS